jgi:hypothetical protein
MTSHELLAACERFEPKRTGDEQKLLSDFSLIVQNAFAVLGLYQRDLADDFEVAESTVSRWGHGVARPHPRIQRSVVAWISRRAAKTTSELLQPTSLASGRVLRAFGEKVGR